MHYDCETGFFTRTSSHNPKLIIGDIAGTNPDNKHNAGYVRLKIDGDMFLAHRLAFLYVNGAFPDDQVDHINHDRSDNRFCNLRECFRSENQKNLKKRKDNKSGICGVHWSDIRRKWIAQMRSCNMSIVLGDHDDFFEACCARKSAEYKHGFHANHGFTKVD